MKDLLKKRKEVNIMPVMIKYYSNYIGGPQSQLICECCGKHLGNIDIKEGCNNIKGWLFCPYCGHKL